MSILSQKSRELHATWRHLESAEGSEECRQHALHELTTTRTGRWARWNYRNPKKTAVLTLSPGASLFSGGLGGHLFGYEGMGAWTSATAGGASPVEWIALSGFALGIVMLFAVPATFAKAPAYRMALDLPKKMAAQARESYFHSVHQDLIANNYTILSSDQSAGSFVTHRGVVMMAENDANEPMLLVDGSPLVKSYESIESAPTVTVKGFDGRILALSGPPLTH